jgi:hypothetical protein
VVSNRELFGSDSGSRRRCLLQSAAVHIGVLVGEKLDLFASSRVGPVENNASTDTVPGR